MEKAPDIFYSDDPQDTEHFDKPAPGWGFLIFLALGAIVPVVLSGYRYMSGENSISLPVMLGLISLFIIMILFFHHIAFNTSYHIVNRQLKARSGFFTTTINLSDIESIEKVSLIRLPVGWHMKWGKTRRGRCNRFTNGIALSTSSKGLVYISPSDPDAFIERLRAARL